MTKTVRSWVLILCSIKNDTITKRERKETLFPFARESLESVFEGSRQAQTYNCLFPTWLCSDSLVLVVGNSPTVVYGEDLDTSTGNFSINQIVSVDFFVRCPWSFQIPFRKVNWCTIDVQQFNKSYKKILSIPLWLL